MPDLRKLRTRLLYYHSRSFPDQEQRWSYSTLRDFMSWSDASDQDIVQLAGSLPDEIEFSWDSSRITLVFMTSDPSNIIVRRVFDYWIEKTGRTTTTRFTNQRKAKIMSRIREGYDEDTLRLAVDGIVRSPWHCGDNPNGRVYTGIEHVFKSGERVESFAGLAPKIDTTIRPRGSVSAYREIEEDNTLPIRSAEDLKKIGDRLWKEEE